MIRDAVNASQKPGLSVIRHGGRRRCFSRVGRRYVDSLVVIQRDEEQHLRLPPRIGRFTGQSSASLEYLHIVDTTARHRATTL